MPIDQFLRSTTFRLSLFYSGLIVVAFAAAAALTYVGSRAAAENEIRRLIDLEAAALAAEIEVEGVEPAIAAIEFRAERPGAFEYWVTDAAGRKRIGDLSGMEGPNGWRRFDVPDGAAGAEGRETMLVYTQSLPGGVRLSVGGDLDRILVVRRAILRTLLGVAGATVLMCLVAGFAFTHLASRRLDRLTATMRAVAAGDLSARVPDVVNGGRASDDIAVISQGVNAMLDRIDSLVSGVRRVSRDVAHDLRTPLFHLRQRLEAARAAANEMKDIEIDAAEEKAVQIVRTFDAILRLSEIEAGAGRSRFADVDLSELIDVAIDAWRPDIEQSGRRLTREGDDALSVRGDRDLLLQAVSNLIENALRHTPAGAHIRIGLSAADPPSVYVADDGRGIPRALADEAVKPFARLDVARTTPGTGLGLSIVSAIATQHDARLSLSDARPGLEARLIFKERRGP